MSSALLAVCVAAAVALSLPVRESAVPARSVTAAPTPGPGWMRRRRPLWALLAGVAALSFLSGPLRLPAAATAVAVTWVAIGRSEPAAVRREREQSARDLPHVVGLLADALRAGQAAETALAEVVGALPGPATERLSRVVDRLRLGIAPGTAWAELADDPAMAPLGRALVRSHATGASVLLTVERLGESLADQRRGEVEDRARAVGVRAALPLGLCLLPSFVLLGIVPVVAGMLGTLGL